MLFTDLLSLHLVTFLMFFILVYIGMFREVDKLLKSYRTFPVTTSTAERSFSSLQHMKTYLGSTMTCWRLNNLFLLYIHQHITDSLDLCKIAGEFYT